MARTEWESTETRRALAFPGDGLLDVFLGLTLLDAWTILRDPPGATSGGSLVILFPLLLVAKRAITIPRLPRGSADPPRPMTPGRARVLGVAAFLGLLALGVRVTLPPPSPPALFSRGWGLVALAGAGERHP